MRARIFRFSILLLAGILLSRVCPEQSSGIILSAILLLVCWVSSYLLRPRFARLLILGSVVITGFFHYQAQRWFQNRKIETNILKIELLHKLAGGWQARINGRYRGEEWLHLNVNALVYGLPEGRMHEGVEVIIRASIDSPQSNGFRRYLADRKINYILSVKQHRIVPIQPSFLARIRYQLSDRISGILDEPGHRALIFAILLGDKSELSDETKSNFQRTGGMHVLAVSGLHVSILYLIIRFILSFLPRYIFFRWLSFILTSAALLMYAGVTGFTPSVNRAVLFFFLFGIGELTNRKPRLIHILPTTACMVWMIDPAQVFSLSFQFSYAAVFGIMLFQPVFENRLTGLHPILSYALRMITVSISAQAFTWPLAAIYFGGVSPIGIIFSVILVPVIFLVLCVCIASITLIDFHVPGRILSYLFRELLYELEDMVAALADYQWSYSALSLDVLFAFCIILLTLLIYRFLVKPSKNLFLSVMLGILCLCIQRVYSNNLNTYTLRMSEANILHVRMTGNVKMKSRNFVIEKYPIQLIKFGESRILITRSAVPLNPADAIVIFKGSQPPEEFNGNPVLIFTKGISGDERQRWIKSARQSGLEYIDAGWSDITIEK